MNRTKGTETGAVLLKKQCVCVCGHLYYLYQFGLDIMWE